MFATKYIQIEILVYRYQICLGTASITYVFTPQNCVFNDISKLNQSLDFPVFGGTMEGYCPRKS